MAAGIYIHIPFCKSRCSYCDFATDIYSNSETADRYVRAVIAEIRAFADAGPPILPVDTVYFGGGTPSLLSSQQLASILTVLRENFGIDPGSEITVEMNPATVTPEKLRSFRALGVDRASFGVQTFDDHALRLLARGHNAQDARETFEMLRAAGFENVSFDLIAGLPAQTLAQWERNLEEAISLSPEHMSLYLLEIHHATPLAEQVRSGRQPKPDDDVAANMYELMLDKLGAAGYSQYEISNFSRGGLESRHNSKYWRLEPVLGFGVSAHSFDGRQRYSNVRDTAEYVARIEATGKAEATREDVDLASEAAFLGLRLETGIDLADHKQRFEIDIEQKYRAELDSLKKAGLIEIVGGRLFLTRRGKLFSNEVFAVFV